MQKSILSHVREATSEVGFNRLCWQLASCSGKDEAPRSFKSHYSSFARAVSKLRSDARIRETSRRLRSQEEFINDYPHKSRDPSVRRMRIQLLPLLVQCNEAPVKRFSIAENESFALRELALPPHDVAIWLDFERRLVACAASVDCHPAWVALLVLVRALTATFSSLSGSRKSVLRKKKAPEFHVTTTSSWTSSMAACRELGVPDLSRLVDELQDKFFELVPPETLRFLRLKSWIRSHVDLDSNGPARMHESSLNELARRWPDQMAAYSRETRRSGWALGPGRVFEKKVLHQLVDRHALEPFKYLHPK